MPILVLGQVDQRLTHLLLLDSHNGVSHGEHLHYIRCYPDTRVTRVKSVITVCKPSKTIS